MAEFTIHDESSVPDGLTGPFDQLKRRFGFIPSLYGVLAESPQAFTAYQGVSEQFRSSSLPEDAQQVVLLAASRTNSCAYCVAVHSTTAAAAGVDAVVIDAIRRDRPIGDERLEAVRRFTRAVVDRRGRVGQDETEAFLAAGFSRRQVLDVLTGVAMKALSNYTNHIVHTPLDDAFAAQAWQE